MGIRNLIELPAGRWIALAFVLLILCGTAIRIVRSGIDLIDSWEDVRAKRTRARKAPPDDRPSEDA